MGVAGELHRGGGAASVEDLKRLLAEAPPACDQVNFSLLGLTLAGWNLIASLGLAVLTFAAALGFDRRPAARRSLADSGA